MFLFWPCLLLFLLISEENRYWLKKKEPYLALSLSLFFFAPVLIWNSQHQWISFLFHSGKVSGKAWGHDFLPFIGDQLVHFTPFLLFALYGISRFALKKDNMTKLLFCFSTPVIILFLLLSLKVKIWAHWPEIGYIGLIPLAIGYLMETGKAWNKFFTWVTGFSLLILSVLFWVSPAVLFHQKDYAQNYRLAELVPSEYKVFSRTNVSSSILEFYLKRPTYLATGFMKIGAPWGLKQYETWGIPDLNKGETIIYYGEDSEEFRQKALANFARITGLPDPRLFLIEDYISNNYRFFKLEGYKGGPAHP